MRLTLGTGAALVSAVALAACGGSTPTAPDTSLSAAERLLVLQQIVTTAASGVVASSLARRSDPGPLGNLSCEKTCSGATCSVSCPIDESFACPAGGTATDRGRIAGVLDATTSGEASLEAAQGFAGCKPNAGLAIDGAPGTTATGTARFANGQLAEQQTVRIRGSVRYATADKNGDCAVDLTVTFDRSLHGSAKGTACGEALSQSL